MPGGPGRDGEVDVDVDVNVDVIAVVVVFALEGPVLVLALVKTIPWPPWLRPWSLPLAWNGGVGAGARDERGVGWGLGLGL